MAQETEQASTSVSPRENLGSGGDDKAAASSQLGSATYEIIRQRLDAQSEILRERMKQLDQRRREVFGSIEFKLLQADRIVTAHNCVPQDMVPLGKGQFLFGFNVRFGLKKEIELGDVFAVYHRDEKAGTFKESDLEVIRDPGFITDFKRVYNVYEKTVFRKFSVIDGSLYMVFSIGAGLQDIAVFKWAWQDGNLRYVDGRAEGEYRRVGFPPAHDFRWRAPDRESFRYGDYPHVSIEDRVFVECTGGDLTIKVEDNTASGEGIYDEPVDDKYQKVDDADIAYAILEPLILLRIRPYKEIQARYFIFNEKLQTVVRVDSLGQSCAWLPEEHGLIFPDGYYLVTGELKQFAALEQDMALERVVSSPNGEDTLYVFYAPHSGEYVLLPYRLIAQKVEERIQCHGFSLFPDGHLLLFRAEEEAAKHHMIQLRQTPFHQPGHEPPGQKEAFLYQVGNKEVVRCLAECNEILTLVRKDNPYAELYTDLVKRCEGMVDAYPWLSSEDGFQVDAALRQMRNAADKAVDEFDKVRRLQREAVQRVNALRRRCEERFNILRRASFKTLNDYVMNLGSLRHLRGELITLKEVRYVDVEALDRLEEQVATQTETLSQACVAFLLKPEALEPYRRQAEEQLRAAEAVAKTAEGREIEKAVTEAGREMELLIEIVNNLKIDDATETTRIIDGITAVYATLNQVKAALKKRLRELVAQEGAAQFEAQMKLLGQSASSYLDLCDTPAKCEEYLNRISVQLEELEGTFADFEEYTVQLSERRTELYEAFEQRKVALVEQRNRKANALMTAAERILKVVGNRLAGCKTVEEIHTYMASDLMITKIRDTIRQLMELDDSIKADDLQGRLKSAQQEAVRQLKDRQELFVGGEDVIKLGKHHFNINTQPLDLTVVNREGTQFLHLTGTKYFEAITDEVFLATRDVWGQELISENSEVYRAEYLAYRLLLSLEERTGPPLAEVVEWEDERLLALMHEFMGTRYQEGYAKGIHDLDGLKLFRALAETHVALGLASYHPTARACALVYWHRFCPLEVRSLWAAKLKGFAERNRLYPGDNEQKEYIRALSEVLVEFVQQTRLYPLECAEAAGAYLFHELIGGDTFAVSQEAETLLRDFRKSLAAKGGERAFQKGRADLAEHGGSELQLVRDWVRGFLLTQGHRLEVLEEMAALLFCLGDGMDGRSASGHAKKKSSADFELRTRVASAETTQSLEGMKGSHSRIEGSRYAFDYFSLRERLERFSRVVVPRFEAYHRVKQSLLEKERQQLRLDEFKPRVLTSFVRNQLIDEVYLPLVGDNLAKQIGAAGDKKRTDLMGLLLVVSPPGYGKTTLMEYIANRLGIVFVKINGPALGHAVASLDPEEAPNAAARQEIQKLNLALEMGDNAMLYVDDIQHCNPEFLQKFISLCDAQRKIEGVWKGRPRTYDLRGRKVVVVMAGNPYTESGHKFQIPDMLSNRADTYNLGDIIGGQAGWFKASYIENAVTSNSVLAPLANKSQKDIRAFIRMAETGAKEVDGFEGSYSSQEVEEILSVMEKLVAIREVILTVNQEYIRSAGQADDYRTEPAFKLQGSYRNMNRLAEKVVPVMNEEEIGALIFDHYKNEAQTLTSGTEANLLKFKELIGIQTEADRVRWEEIKKTFRRNQLVRGGDAKDPVGRVVSQLSAFQAGLESIQQTLAAQLTKAPAPLSVDLSSVTGGLEALRAALEKQSSSPPVAQSEVGLKSAEVGSQLAEGLAALREDLSRAISAVHRGSMADKVNSLSHEMEMLHSTLATLKDMAARQRDHLRQANEMLRERARQGTVEIQLTEEMMTNEQAFLEHFHQVLDSAQKQRADTENEPPPLPEDSPEK